MEQWICQRTKLSLLEVGLRCVDVPSKPIAAPGKKDESPDRFVRKDVSSLADRLISRQDIWLKKSRTAGRF